MMSPAPVRNLPVPGDTRWLTPQGKVLLNGTLIDVTDAEGKPRSILVLSHYMEGHARKDVPLPTGWKFVGFRHRGEYEFIDGKLTRLNNTSGTAFKNEEDNRNETAKDYLFGSEWTTSNTKYVDFALGDEHFYPAFNREPPADVKTSKIARDKYLHGGRAALRTKLSYLSLLVSIPKTMPEPEVCREILKHWEIQTAGASKSPGLDFVKQMLEEQVATPDRPLDNHHFETMSRAIKQLIEERRVYQYVEIP